MKRRILDAYSCAGGAAKGYTDAGFDVYGVDLDKQPRYPYAFKRADVIRVLTDLIFGIGVDFTHKDGTVETLHLSDFDAIHASPPCFIAGTPVLTRRGSVAIEEVVVGDEVWTHKNRWREVTDTMSREADTVRVGPITCTPDHPFYTSSQTRTYAGKHENPQYPWTVGEPTWTRASDTKGQFLASPYEFDAEEEFGENNPWLAGRYVADGWTGRDGLMIAVGSGKEEEFESRSDIDVWKTSKTGKSCSRYTAPLHSLSGWLEFQFGKYAAHKTIPAWVLGAPEGQRREFLEGYLSGDGSKTPNGWAANTVSKNLASQLRLLALTLGYSSNVIEVKTSPKKIIEGREVSQQNYWCVRAIENRGRYTRDEGGLYWTKQRKDVEPAGHQTVYDITVDEDHSFTAWGYIVHNCQAFSKTSTLHDNKHPELIEPTRELLNQIGLPWIMENVVGAPLIKPIMIEGRHFGMSAPDVDGVMLKLVRPRLFESNFPLLAPTTWFPNPTYITASIYGNGGSWSPRWRDSPDRRGGYIIGKAVGSKLLNVDWMTKNELSQCIPPKFCEFVGTQLQNHIDSKTGITA